MAFALMEGARLSLIPTQRRATLTTPQASLHATDRIIAPPVTGLLTLGFNTGRFPPTLPACYRASWQLPGPDSHRQATTSLRTRRSATSTHSLSSRPAGRTPDLVQVVLQIGLERLDRHPSTPGAPLFALTFSQACQTSHFEISNGLPDDFSSFTQTPPKPHGFWLIRTNTATDDPAPSLHPHYRSFITTTSRSASAPRNGTHTPGLDPGLLPLADTAHTNRRQAVSGTRLLTFRARAADQAHVASMPDTTWPVNGHPPGSLPGLR